MKALKISWMLVAILTSSLFFASCFREDNPVSEKEQSEAVFQKQLDEALAWAQVYGPSTQAPFSASMIRYALSSTTSNRQPLGTTPSAVTSTRPPTTATGETSSIWHSTIFKQRYR